MLLPWSGDCVTLQPVHHAGHGGLLRELGAGTCLWHLKRLTVALPLSAGGCGRAHEWAAGPRLWHASIRCLGQPSRLHA